MAKGRPVRLKANPDRIREALLHVVAEADAARMRLTQFEIAKTMFLADQAHLRRYGRPITFDEYVAMRDGPVPSLIYDVLKGKPEALRYIGLERPAWKIEGSGGLKKFFSGAERPGSEDILSESDMEELSRALRFVKKRGYQAIWDMVHKDPAYLDAWGRRGERGQYPINYAFLFAEPNEAAANDLGFMSELA